MNTGNATRGKAVFQQAIEGRFERLFEALPGDVNSFTRALDAIVATSGSDVCLIPVYSESKFRLGKAMYMQVCGFYGSLEHLQVLVERFGTDIFDNSNDVDMICAAIKFGRTDIYEYLMSLRNVNAIRRMFSSHRLSKGFAAIRVAQVRGYNELVGKVMADFNIQELTWTRDQVVSIWDAMPRPGNFFYDVQASATQDTLDLIAYMREMD